MSFLATISWVSASNKYPGNGYTVIENAGYDTTGYEMPATGGYPEEELACQPAFPGAEGFGRYARGGRGGDVILVAAMVISDGHHISPSILKSLPAPKG